MEVYHDGHTEVRGLQWCSEEVQGCEFGTPSRLAAKGSLDEWTRFHGLYEHVFFSWCLRDLVRYGLGQVSWAAFVPLGH